MQQYLVAYCATCYDCLVIKSFKHKGIEQFFRTGKAGGVQPKHKKRLQMQLIALDTAHSIDDMDIPGFRLHRLKGKSAGRWSVWVNGNWRLTFDYDDGNVYIVNYEDYH